jgi:hypothetical protein
MKQSLQLLKQGQSTNSLIMDFGQLKEIVGFTEYEKEMNYFRQINE